jgi:hypothetical protein
MGSRQTHSLSPIQGELSRFAMSGTLPVEEIESVDLSLACGRGRRDARTSCLERTAVFRTAPHEYCPHRVIDES